MATRLVNVGNEIDTAKYGKGTYGQELVPTAGGGFSFFFSRTNPASTPTNFLQDTNLLTVGADATVRGKPMDLGQVNVEASKAQANGSLIVAVDQSSMTFTNGQPPKEGKIALGVLSQSGSFSTFYTAKLLPVAAPVGFGGGLFESDVAYGKDNSIALAHIAEDGFGTFRAVDIINAKHKFVASVVIDRNLTADQAGSTQVLALSDGRYLVTWAESTGNIVARIVKSDGKASGANFVIGRADDLATPNAPDVLYTTTALANGNFAVSYQSSEYYYDPVNPASSQNLTSGIKGSVWTTTKSGGFAKGGTLAQDATLKDADLQSLITLSTGQILEIVHEREMVSGNKSVGTLHGYLYGQDGKYTGDHFEFYSKLSGNSSFEYGGYAVALDGGRFALVTSEHTSFGSSSYDYHDTVQVYSLATDGYSVVKGATAGADTLKGNAVTARAELLSGLSGNDTLFGYGGNDRLIGAAGNDTLDGGKGADRMEGGLGNDVIIVDNRGDKVVELKGQGLDLVKASVSYTLTDNVEALTLTGTGNVDGFGNALSNTLTGNSGHNVLDGSRGADIMKGLAGNDTYYVDNGKDQVIELARQGSDTIYASVDYKLADGQFIETLKADQPFFNVSPGSLPSGISLTGNTLANTVVGNYTSDVLSGGGGGDTLTGGYGADAFVFDTKPGAANVDHITDFSAYDDTIRLDDGVFKGLASGTLSASAFKNLSLGPVDADDRILYDSKSGTLYHDADGIGAGERVEFAVLDTRPAITHADFMIV